MKTLTAILALTLAAALPADAGEFRSGGVIAGPRGGSATFERSIRRSGDGVLERRLSVEGRNGRGFTRQMHRVWDRDSRSFTREGSLTANDGRSWTSSASGGCADSRCAGTRVLSGPEGRQAVRESDWIRTEAGRWEGRITHTGPGGRTVTTERWFQVVPEE